jgi:hypothetical protein
MSLQPPKKRAAPSASTSAPKKARQSKLAKENDISGEEENEIKEVFHIFSEPNEEFPKEKEGVIAREDVRKALVYVSLSPSLRVIVLSNTHGQIQSSRPLSLLLERTPVHPLRNRPHSHRPCPLRAVSLRCRSEAAIAI